MELHWWIWDRGIPQPILMELGERELMGNTFEATNYFEKVQLFQTTVHIQLNILTWLAANNLNVYLFRGPLGAELVSYESD